MWTEISSEAAEIKQSLKRVLGGRDSQISRQSANEGQPYAPANFTPGIIPGTHFGATISMKNSNDATRNRTRDLPACSQLHHHVFLGNEDT